MKKKWSLSSVHTFYVGLSHRSSIEDNQGQKRNSRKDVLCCLIRGLCNRLKPWHLAVSFEDSTVTFPMSIFKLSFSILLVFFFLVTLILNKCLFALLLLYS